MVEEPAATWRELLHRPEGSIYALGTLFLGKDGRLPAKKELLESIGTEEGHYCLLFEPDMRTPLVREAVSLVYDGFENDALAVGDITSYVLMIRAAQTVKDFVQAKAALIIPLVLAQILNDQDDSEEAPAADEQKKDGGPGSSTVM